MENASFLMPASSIPSKPEQEAQLLLGMADHTGPVVKLHTFGNWSGSHPGSWTPVLFG